MANHQSMFARPKEWRFAYDASQEFPEVPFGLGLTIQLVWLTPEIAKEWDAMCHPDQRTMKSGHLQSMIRDHREDLFIVNAEPVHFDEDGYLINGHHRVTMVLKTGKPLLVAAIRGLPFEVYKSFDNTAKRSGGDALKLSGHVRTHSLAAALGTLESYEKGILADNARAVYSPSTITTIADRHPGMTESQHIEGKMRGFASPSTYIMTHYVLSRIDREAADEFFDKLASGASLEKGNPILALRNFLIKGNHRPRTVVVAVFRCWNDWRYGETRMLVRVNDNDTIPEPE